MLIRLSIVVVSLLAVVGCKNLQIRSVGDEEEPRSEVASWEAPAYEPPPGPSAEEMEEIRRQNEELKDRVSDLSDRVDELKEAEKAAVVREEEPEPAPTVDRAATATSDADRLALALRRAGVTDLEVATSPAGEVYVVLPGHISFGAGRADLKQAAQSRLARLSDVLKNLFPETSLRMDGHTDSDPIRKSKWASNMQLSEARASAVSGYFVAALNWPQARISTRGFGADRPIATNATRDGKAQNRRVEIVLVR